MCSAQEVSWKRFFFFLWIMVTVEGGGWRVGARDLNSGPQRIRQPDRVDLE